MDIISMKDIMKKPMVGETEEQLRVKILAALQSGATEAATGELLPTSSNLMLP